MTMTPEQFNKIVLKKDLEEFEERLKEDFPSKKQVEKLQSTMDSIAHDHQNFDAEKASNLAAHNRLHENINEVRKEVGMNSIPTA